MVVDINTLVGVVISIIVSVLMFVLGIKTTAPKLIIGGGGSGSGGSPDSVHHTNIGIMNDPRFFGMRLDRQAANIVQAFLIDKKTKANYPLPNNWQVNGVSNTSREASIDVGKQKNLNLFVQVINSKEYYVCGESALEITKNSQSFSDDQKEFTLVIRDSVGREYRFDIVVINRGQNIQVRSAITFAQRLYMVNQAFSLIFRAIKPSKFE